MSDSGPSLTTGASGPIGPGPRLRAARTKMAVEIREVADALNLPSSMIEAIEANDFAAMPSLVFARGYVRAYAKLVELDPDPVVQAFSQASAPSVETGTASPSATSTATLRVADDASVGERLGALRTALENRVRDNPLAALGILAAAMLLLMVLFWLLLGGSAESDPSGVAAAGTEPAVVAQQPPSGRVEPEAQRGGFTESPVTGGGRASLAAPANPELSAAELPLAPADQVRVGDGDDRLRFTFQADCWVEVQDPSERVLYSDLGQSGKQLELIGQGPFNILLGYAPGARLSFNGENVVLAPHTRNDVARLVLGQ